MKGLKGAEFSDVHQATPFHADCRGSRLQDGRADRGAAAGVRDGAIAGPPPVGATDQSRGPRLQPRHVRARARPGAALLRLCAVRGGAEGVPRPRLCGDRGADHPRDAAGAVPVRAAAWVRSRSAHVIHASVWDGDAAGVGANLAYAFAKYASRGISCPEPRFQLNITITFRCSQEQFRISLNA